MSTISRKRMTKEEKQEYLEKLLDYCKEMKDWDNIKQKTLAKELGTSIPNLLSLYAIAIHKGLNKIILEEGNEVKATAEYPFINKRKSLIIGWNIIDKLNEGVSKDEQFKEEDKFNPTRDGDKIILTLRK